MKVKELRDYLSDEDAKTEVVVCYENDNTRWNTKEIAYITTAPSPDDWNKKVIVLIFK